MLKNSKSYLGTWSHDKIPKLPNKTFSGIVNLDNSRGAGTHWVCVYHDKNKPFTEYIDSFGLPFSDIIEKKLKQVKPKILIRR